MNLVYEPKKIIDVTKIPVEAAVFSGQILNTKNVAEYRCKIHAVGYYLICTPNHNENKIRRHNSNESPFDKSGGIFVTGIGKVASDSRGEKEDVYTAVTARL